MNKVALSPGKKESLRQSRDAIRRRIENYFKEKLEVEVPKFHAQGSFATETTVNPLDGEFDLDDGVYLQHLDEYDQSGWPTPETVHGWIVDATRRLHEGKTDRQANLRSCPLCRPVPHRPAVVCNAQRQADVGREGREGLAQ